LQNPQDAKLFDGAKPEEVYNLLKNNGSEGHQYWVDRAAIVDRWGNPYVFDLMKSPSRLSIRSCGKDGQLETKDDIVDIRELYLPQLRYESSHK
jgi:hypothetical protein